MNQEQAEQTDIQTLDDKTEDDYQYPERRSQAGSAERNSKVIATTIVPFMQKWLQQSNQSLRILEVGSGEGYQLMAIAKELNELSENDGKVIFQPLEADKRGCEDIDKLLKEFKEEEEHGRIIILPSNKLEIDLEEDWIKLQSSSNDYFDILMIFNIVHIIPFSSVMNLFKSANNLLHPLHGKIILYGAFDEVGIDRSQGNENFDKYLKQKNKLFGLRNVEMDIEPLAKRYNLLLEERIEMPSGNPQLDFVPDYLAES